MSGYYVLPLAKPRMNCLVATRWQRRQELCLRNYCIQFRISDKLSSCVIKTMITGQFLWPCPSVAVAQNGLMNLDGMRQSKGCFCVCLRNKNTVWSRSNRDVAHNKSSIASVLYYTTILVLQSDWRSKSSLYINIYSNITVPMCLHVS